MPSNKLIYGIPTFGRTWSLSKFKNGKPPLKAEGVGDKGEYTLQDGLLSYYEICQNGNLTMEKDEQPQATCKN